MPTPDELAAKIDAWADQGHQLADELRRLDDDPAPVDPTPDPQPTPDPVPTPEPAVVPAKPTGLAVALTAAATTLTWDPADGATEWDVLDTANTAAPLKQTVTVPRYVGSPYKPGKPARRYAVKARNAAGESELSDAVDVPPAGETPAPTPTPSTPSTSGVDLSRWKLTIPEASAGKVVEIKPPALSTYSSRYFERLADGSLRFRCWHGGATTSGSANPRSELRERVGDDPEGYWDASKGRHVMEWAGQVNRLTKVRPFVVIGQVHDDKDDVVVWRVEGDKLWLTDGNNNHGHLVDGAFTLGKPYTCRYEITAGQYAFFYNGQRVDYALKSTAKSYFKVGNYLQSNPTTAPGESTAEYAEVVVSRVTVTHA